ncbi:WG repeat-containing protein [Brumimicrobium glaciale]|uniref:WG repeat-containing protein n=1 Tax=Brumimicrobium glaciale TaxID=200475 RepID=A0A4Q4KGH9_9FLAO|nr:WG repeat-containing protein [Brumimicrobium glaciale]RYM31344.1 WG repeat-containing protein [Brumimicrobium glaciale]
MKIFLFSTLLLCSGLIYSQIEEVRMSGLTIKEALQSKMPKMPQYPDTVYYPFYQGVQMIEVDHIGFRDKKVYHLGQSQPRAMSYSDMIPMSFGNEYFFRDTLGSIVKAFNSDLDLISLTKHFRKVPLNFKSKFANFFPYHISQDYIYQGIWAYSGDYLFNFKGHYKVFDNSSGKVPNGFVPFGFNKESVNLMFGLIDSLGSVKIPLEYNEIIPWHENLIVSKNGKWGIINYDLEIIVPLVYDSYRIVQEKSDFYPDRKFDIYFLNTKKEDNYKNQYSIVALYNSSNHSLIKLNGYDEIFDFGRYKDVGEYDNRKIKVKKNGKKGVLNSSFIEIVAPQYEMFNDVGDLIQVNKNGKFGFLNKNYEIEIPLEYDYAQYIDDSTFLVLKNGAFYCINIEEEKKKNDNLKPNWKVQNFNVAIDNYVTIQVGDHIGVLNTLTNRMVLPIRYEKSKQITPMFYEDFRLRNDSIFKQKNLIVREKADIYDEISFSDNKIIVKNENELFGVIDSSFNNIIDFKYDKLERYPRNPEYLIYLKNGKAGIMDFSKKDIIAGKFNEIRIERDRPLFQVQDKDKWGIVNLSGDEVIACQYDSIRFLGHWDRPKENLWIVNRGKKYGVINDQNEIMVPFIYDGISHLHANNLWVMDKDKKRYSVNYR